MYLPTYIDMLPKVGPISSLEYMIENSISDQHQEQIIMHLSCLDEYVFRWRSINGDGNCFYRSVIFAFLEQIIFDKDTISLKKIIVDIKRMFNKDFLCSQNCILDKETIKEIIKINTDLIIKILLLIYEILDVKKDSNLDTIQISYETILKSFNCSSQFDLVFLC
jgi:hypothetical protein